LDPNDFYRPRISYVDVTGKSIGYAKKTAMWWEFYTVDSFTGTNTTSNCYTSIKLNSSGTAFISYVYEEGATPDYHVAVSKGNGTSWQKDYIREMVGGGGTPDPTAASLAIDPQNNLHLCFGIPVTGELYYYSYNGSWSGGQITEPEITVSLLGGYCSLAYDSKNTLLKMSFYDEYDYLAYAYMFPNGTWVKKQLHDGFASGDKTSIAVSNNGVAHITYRASGMWHAEQLLAPYWYNRSFPSPGNYPWNVSCNKTYFDTKTAEDTVLISNHLPTQPVVILNSTFGTNLTTENLTCWANATDADADEITYNGFWYKNGLSQYDVLNYTFGWGSSDQARSTAVDSQDNIVAVGRTNVNGDYDALAVKFLPDGTHLWNKTFNYSSFDEADGVAIDNDDNIIMCGSSSGNGFLTKLNSSGDVLWNVTVSGGAYGGEIYGLTIDANGDLVIVGGKDLTGAGKHDFWVLKYNATNGNKIWEKTFTHGVNILELAYGVVTNNNRDIYLTGWIGLGTEGLPVLKLNSAGTLLWKKTFKKTTEDIGYGITLDSLERPVVTGKTGFSNPDVWTFKLDASGNSLWNATIGGSQSEGGRGIILDYDDNIFVAAYTNSFGAGLSDLWLLRYDASGNLLSNDTFGGSSNDQLGLAGNIVFFWCRRF